MIIKHSLKHIDTLPATFHLLPRNSPSRCATEKQVSLGWLIGSIWLQVFRLPALPGADWPPVPKPQPQPEALHPFMGCCAVALLRTQLKPHGAMGKCALLWITDRIYRDNGSCVCILINHRKWLSLYYVPITHLQQLVNKTWLCPYKHKCSLIISRIDRSEKGKNGLSGGNRTIRVPNIKLGDLKCSASYRISQEHYYSKSSSSSPLTSLSLSLYLALLFFLLWSWGKFAAHLCYDCDRYRLGCLSYEWRELWPRFAPWFRVLLAPIVQAS